MSTSTHEYCPGCDDIVPVGEPCECVFVERGTVDARGVLHTAPRVSAEWAEEAAQLAYENAHLEIDEEIGDLYRYEDNDAEAEWFRFMCRQ